MFFCFLTECDETITSKLQATTLSDTEGTESSSRKEIHNMTPEDVKDWLIHEVGIPSSVAIKFQEEGIQGALLDRYEEEHLQKDFELSKGIMRRILYARDDLRKCSSREKSIPTC